MMTRAKFRPLMSLEVSVDSSPETIKAKPELFGSMIQTLSFKEEALSRF